MAWIISHVSYKGDGCLIWPFGKSRGYGMCRNDEGENGQAHVIMCEKAHGPRPSPKHEVAHSCGKGRTGCIHPEHIRWATRGENHADKKLHGTEQKGEAHGCAKLTEKEVLEIRSLRGRFNQYRLAELYGIKQPTVSAIQVGRIWGWL